MALTPSARAGVGFRVSLLSDSSTTNPLTRRLTHGIADTTFGHRGIIDLGIGAREPGVTFDSTYTQATLTLKMHDTNLMQPVILPYSSYAEQKMRYDLNQQWRDLTDKNYKTTGRLGAGEGLAIDLPYRIKSKTFRKLFGGDNVGVRVQGNISINGSLRKQKFDENQGPNQQNANTAFRIDMVQQFTITGKVGQKVEVKVDQDSERLFDFENSLKLTYTGDEDEIIQKIEAGNVALNLGTRLATFSGKNTGLFGLKTDMKAGPLKVTGIASLERGQKNRLSRGSQGATHGQFNDQNFLRDTYFWITNTWTAGDNRHVPNFREYYRHYENRNHIVPPEGEQIQDIEVFVSVTGNQQGNNTPGQAAAMQFIEHINDPPTGFPANGGNFVQTQWQRLNKDLDYEVDLRLGFIRLKRALTTSGSQPQALACAFRLKGDTTAFGTLQSGSDNRLRLVLLWPEISGPQDSTWNLMFRHVYSLGATNIDPQNFKMDIVHRAANNPEEAGPPGRNETYLTYFEFDRDAVGGAQTPDGLIDNAPAIKDFVHGEINFLDLTPFNPSGYIRGGIGSTDTVKWDLHSALEAQPVDSGKYTAPYLYDQLPSSWNQQQSPKWNFRTEYQGSTSVYDLGVLVLENSEEVTLNGQKLNRGTDYTVDYSSGKLTILNQNALAAGANLDITYESGRTSTLDKTSLLGARAEYGLWQDSYVGGMLLYLNQSTLDKRVRIGMEPIRNTLYDANTSLKFKPEFLTRAVDALPLIRSDSPSDFTIDAEVARVYPNPNSLSNPRTGDYNGLAYVDDFEGSRRGAPLGLSRRTWTVSSIPIDPDIAPRRGRLRWYNPNTRDQVPVKDVFPEREVNSQVANTLQSIIFEFKPDGTDYPARKSWGGVMRYLGEGYQDQTRSQYLEFWVNVPSFAEGTSPDARLVVDLGQISEDAIPNDTLDTEDQPLPGQQRPGPRQSNGNGVLGPGDEDVGLDGRAGSDPNDMAYWNGLDQPPVPSWDDWQFTSGSSDFSHVNGTERNRNDEGGGYPDTEDLNNNSNLETDNSYFSYTIKLNDPAFASKYVAGENPHNRWRMFRIPIKETDPNVRREVNHPQLDRVRWARVYLTGVDDTTRYTKVELVQMDIVSNEWLAATTPTDTTEYVSTAVINTHENPGYYSPPGVEGEVDPITNLRQREQSLVLKINGLNTDNDPRDRIPQQFFVSKNLYQDMNLTEYKRLKMFVHGGGMDGTHFKDGVYQLILRFAQTSDLNNNYYDIVETVHPGWDPKNAIDVAMNELSNLNPQRAAAVAAQDTSQHALTIAGRYAVPRLNTPYPDDSLVIMGSPTMSRVGFIALGVRMLDNPRQETSGNEEIWVDELRVSDIYKDPGTAADLSSTLNIADFVQLSGGYRTSDADFHNVNTRVNASNYSTNSILGNATLNLHKIWLERFGFRLPISFSYNESHQIPRLIPLTDTRIRPSEAPDSIKSNAKTMTYHAQYSKAAGSKNKLVGWTLEKLTASWDYSLDERSDYLTAQNRSEQSSAQAAYTFPTAKGRGVPPLWWAKRLPLLKKVADMRFYFKPTKLALNAQASKRVQDVRTRAGISTPTRQFLTVRSLNTGFQPFDPITMDYTRTHKGQYYSGDWVNLLMYDWGRTYEISQNLTNTYNPELLAWFKPTFSYSSSYGWANDNPAQSNGQHVSNQRNLGADVTLDFRSIFGESGGRGGGRRGRDRDREPGGPGGLDEPGGLGRLPGIPGDSLGLPREGMMPPRGEGLPPRGGLPGDSLHGQPGRPGARSHATGDTTRAKSDTTKARPKGASPLQLIAQAFRPVRKALTIIDPVALSWDNTASHSESGTLGQAKLPYQFGLSTSPGTGVAEGFVASPLLRTNQKITARSGMRVTQDIRLSFNYSHDASENTSQYKTGSVEQTKFWLGSKKTPTDFPFVDLSVDWGGLEKVKFISSVVKTVTLSSALSNRVRDNWASRRDSVQTRDYTRNWNPLLRLNVSWKGDIDSQIGFNSSSTFTNHIHDKIKQRSTDNRLTASLSYTIHTGFRVPLFIMRSIHLQNQTTFSLNVDYGKQKTENTQAGNDVFAPTNPTTSSWSIQPNMTYSFSNTVQGRGWVQFQQTKNDINGSKSRVFEFGIQVNIAIRG